MSEPDVGGSRLIAGRYELDARIGKGGIGEVWRARHLALNSYVAIKFLQGASAQNESTRRRFTTEAQVTAQLKSQHAVQVFDFGVTDEGHPYLVMELLEGETLGRRLERRGRLEILETARILGQSARALHRAHQLGIVHRDFKPDNIVIGADDEGRDYVKVVDFGLAKLVGDLDTPGEPAPDLASAPASTFTKTGAMLGTPFYMAPEQVRSASNVDLRADIWAFGVVAFECLTGCTPFTGDTLAELFEKIESGKHPLANKLEPSVPSGFHDWFDTACAPDPAKRFPDANTAWKRLLVALECGKIDIDPSMQIGRTLSASGERQVVVESDANMADGNAITLDVEARDGRKGVESRQRKSLRKQATESTPSRAPEPAPSEPAPLSHSIAEEDAKPHPRVADPLVDTTVRRRRKPAGRGRTLLVAVPLVALAGVVAWRAASTPATHAPEPVEARVQPTQGARAPGPVTVESASPSATTATATATAPPPSASGPTPPLSRAPTPTPRPRARPAIAAPTAGSARPAAVAPTPSPPITPPPATPATPPADPGSYR